MNGADGLHGAVIRPTAAFGAGPCDVLRRVFNVAGFAVQAVGRVDLQARLSAVLLHNFIHAGRAVARFGAGVLRVI